MKIYVAGPYTNGDVAENVSNAIFYGDEILNKGHIPFIPHLTHFWHFKHWHPYQAWIDYDLEWLKVCDGFIRIPGTSKGAAKEEIEARRLGLQIFTSLAQIKPI